MKIPEFFHNAVFLSDEELNSFEMFLMSPYFNATTSLPIVFKIIKNNIGLIKEKKYDELKTILVNESKYTENTVSKSLSYLNDMYAEFINVQELKQEKFYRQYFGCKYLLHKGNYRYLDRRIEDIENYVSNQENFDDDLFLKLYEFNKIKYGDIYTSKNKLDTLSKLDNEKEYTLESSKNLFIHTLAKSTVNFADYVIQCSSSTKKTNRKYPVNLESMFDIIKSPEFKSYNSSQKKTITLYYKLYKLFSNLTNDRFYKSYKDFYNKVKELYNREFRNTHLSIMMNYCFLRYRVKDKDKYFLAEGHKILYEYIDGRYYINDDTEYLHSTIYRNYVVYCSTKDRKDVLKKFIDNHTDKLNPEETELMRNFAMAHYCYVNEQNKESLKYTEKLNNAKFFYKFDLIFLKIKIYYENQDMVSLENMVHILRNNLETEVIFNKNEVEKYEYLIYCLNLLVKAHAKYDKTLDIFDFEYLMKKIESKPSFAIRKWLEDKVREFIRKHQRKR